MFNQDNRRSFILFLCMGILLTVQIRILSKDIQYVGIEDIQELTGRIYQEEGEVEQLKLLLSTEQEKLNFYIDAVDNDEGALLDRLQEEKKYYEKLVNYTDVQGPGVIVIIDDAERELFDNEPGDNVLVHDQDVGIIVNELRAAGAEAISINDTRIIFSKTRIVCVGPTVRINGEQMTAPFIIKAIGNKNFLEAAINAPGTFSEVLAGYGLFVEANTSVSVEIGKYDGVLKNWYMEIYEEGE